MATEPLLNSVVLSTLHQDSTWCKLFFLQTASTLAISHNLTN